MRELPLAEKLRRLRGDRKQKTVAEANGISPATLCKLERGDRGTTNSISKRETLRRLATYYGVLPEYLIGGPCDYLPAWGAMAFLDPDLHTPGLRLRRLIREMDLRYGVSAPDLARELLITPQDLDDYLTDKLPTSTSVLEQLAELTGIPVEWISKGAPAGRWTTADYRQSLSMAAANGIPPEVIEEFIRDWLARNTK